MIVPETSRRFAEALEELRTAANISEQEGDTPTLSYIRDLIEQLNRALREVTFGEDRCPKEAALRRLSPRRGEEESGQSEGNAAITTSGIRRTTCSRSDDALAPTFYPDYPEDKILDQCEISIRVRRSCGNCRRKLDRQFPKALLGKAF